MCRETPCYIKVYPNHHLYNRLKKVEKLYGLKSQLKFSEPSQTEWPKPFDFPARISGFPSYPSF